MNDCRTTNERQGRVMRRLLLGAMALLFALVLCPMLAAHAEAQTVEVGIPVEEHPELFHTRSMPTHGEGKIAVFLIQFPDQMNDNPYATREQYDKMYFRGGADVGWYNMTVAKFFEEQSYGKLKLSGQVFDWYTAKHERSYYDNRKAELVVEAAAYYAGTQGVDFSDFDGDGDGVIDAIVYHFAGESTEKRYSPWYDGIVYGSDSYFGEIGGVRFTTMVQISHNEAQRTNSDINTICHELMHTLGMPDLYGEVTFALDPVNDLMSDGVSMMINPYTKILLGWIDTVKVITEGTKDIRLDLYGDSDGEDAVIVAKEFNGFFDEFYVVAYRQRAQYTTPVIWHIDARPNDKGTAFLCQNLYYDVAPTKDNPHDSGFTSPYLFIEELSGDPSFDYVLNRPISMEQSAFDNDAVLGPNSVPSSDTHDGDYTGIKIDNFVEHDDTYLTFDVSYISDTTPPEIVTTADDLAFKETIKIHFSEFIYAGENIDAIKVTDLDGNIINASISLSYYPRHEVEITFQDASYKNGYRIVFPDGCIQDSSGNELESKTITANHNRYFFPISQRVLPNTDGYRRVFPVFFAQNDGLVMITYCVEGDAFYAKIEFMRLSRDGDVLTHTIVDNPFDGSEIVYVIETGDGSYVFVCRQAFGLGNYDLLFCLDSNGQLKWTNDTYYDSGNSFYGYHSFKQGDDVVTLFNDNEMVRISSQNGEVEIFKLEPENQENPDAGASPYYAYVRLFNLSDGELLCQKVYRTPDKKLYMTRVEILDAETFNVKRRLELEGDSVNFWEVHSLQAYDDGTVALFCSMKLETKIFLLDVDMKIVKSLSLSPRSSGGNKLVWFEEDGFCEIIRTAIGDHDNNQFHVRRFDRYLNEVWESDVVSLRVHYFKSSADEILACKLMYEGGEYYIENYGQDDKFKTKHTHSLIYSEEVAAGCSYEGCRAYWSCSVCGCRFSDEGKTLILDPEVLVIPRVPHTEETIDAVAPTCTGRGSTKGTKCSVCGEILVKPGNIPPTGVHVYEFREVVKEATCQSEGEEIRRCSCGKEKTNIIPITEDNHSYGEWSVIKAATCVAEGEESRACTCGKTETRAVAPTGVHVYGEWTVVTAATCGKAGEESRTCACGETETREIPATGEHAYGEWLVSCEATRDTEGEEIRTCGDCGEKESRLTDKLPAPDVPVTLIAVIGGAVLIGALVILLLVRKRKRS